MKTLEEKYQLFCDNVTFYLPDRKYDNDLAEALDKTVEWVKSTGRNLTAARLYELMEENPTETFGFIRAATGVSLESIKKLFVAPKSLSRGIREELGVNEWSDKYKNGHGNVYSGIRECKEIRQGLARLFVHGKTIDPPFCQREEQNKYSLRPIHDLASSPDSVIRRTIESRIKTTFRNQKSLRYEEVVRTILSGLNVSYASGISDDLFRNVDCIIPNQENPEIIIECTWFDTTSSAQSDKARSFVKTVESMKRRNKDLKAFLFVDGYGWARRSSDLKLMLDVCDDVFTYRRSQLRRFAETIKELRSVQEAA